MTFAKWYEDNSKIINANIWNLNWGELYKDFAACWHDGWKIGYELGKNQTIKERIKMKDCYQCNHVHSIPGDAHKSCDNVTAKVKGDPHGIKRGWFFWPINFDPTWLISCDGFEEK